MPHELTMAQMALNATAARRVDDEAKARYWDELIDAANLRQWRADNEWDCLKGSPEHDGRIHA